MGDVDLAFIRHTGPYEQVDESLWTELAQWARASDVEGPRVFIGIGHDAPGVTPDDRLRFDAAVRIPPEAADRVRGRIGHQRLPVGHYARTTHVGPYETLFEAYGAIFERLNAMTSCRIIGLPIVEIYQTTRVDPSRRLNHTDTYIPVEVPVAGT